MSYPYHVEKHMFQRKIIINNFTDKTLTMEVLDVHNNKSYIQQWNILPEYNTTVNINDCLAHFTFFVNSREVVNVVLRPGDELTIGD